MSNMVFKEPKFKQEIQQMMYVAGETQDSSLETVSLIEALIHEQVVQMLITAQDLAHRRGAQFFSNNDLIFQIRHDAGRMERVRNFLTWKAIRKTVKDEGDKDGVEDAGLDEDQVSGPVNEGAPRTGVPKSVQPSALPWDVTSFFRTQLPEEEAVEDMVGPETLGKLLRNDERTRVMTMEEYKTWSEYRHASFTRRKVKRFREWAGLGVIADHKPTDDVLDILGLILSEMVQSLTAQALKIQEAERRERGNAMETALQSRGHTDGIFSPPPGMKIPIGPDHVRQAFQIMQAGMIKKRPFNGTGQSLKLI